MRSGLILAGGESKRFGSPKALVEVRGVPMIVRVAGALERLVDETIVSVADASIEARIRRDLPDSIFVRDEGPARGPIEGFRRGFGRASGETVLVAPCDAPLLRADLYLLLMDALEGHEAAVPRIEVFDPVRAAYRTNPVQRLLRDPRNRVPSPSALVDRLDAAIVSVEALRRIDPDLRSFRDVNEPADLESVLGLRAEVP